MTETPKYAVIKKKSEIEIRYYPAYIQAEVVIDENQNKSAIEKGLMFWPGYIFGNNVSKQKIEMTSPVQASQSEKLAMTTPVTVTGESGFTVAFIMLSAPTLYQRPHIKAAATDQYLQFGFLSNLFQRLKGQLVIHSQAKILVGLDYIDEMVRDRCPLRKTRLIRADIHIPVDLAAIRAYYLQGKVLSKVQSKLTLPYTGGTNDSDH